jgi:hypothetical protein
MNMRNLKLSIVIITAVFSFASQPTIVRADEASDDCLPATLSGESDIDPSSGAFVGVGNLGIGNARMPVDWVSTISSFVTNVDGTLSITSSHHITSTTGNSIDFTTTDNISAVPTDVAGVYLFTSSLTVEAGHGRVRGGYLNVTGQVDLVHGHVALTSSNGNLCSDL